SITMFHISLRYRAPTVVEHCISWRPSAVNWIHRTKVLVLRQRANCLMDVSLRYVGGAPECDESVWREVARSPWRPDLVHAGVLVEGVGAVTWGVGFSGWVGGVLIGDG